ncbi:uncharacterized protein [Equus caballus]|uniref:uncharacterized protein n=1 Tax=Equus caballus TaxID=9796 RepID=UPI0038B27332
MEAKRRREGQLDGGPRSRRRGSFSRAARRELRMPHIFRGLHKDQTAGCRGRTGPGLWERGAETQGKLEPEPPCPPGCTPPTTLRLPPAALRCPLAVTLRCPPPCAPLPARLRSPPAPRPLGRRPGLGRHLPRLPPGLCPAAGLCLSPSVSVSPCGAPSLPAGSPSPSPSGSLPCLPLPLPGLSPLRVSLCLPARLCPSLPPTLGAAPLSRTQAPPPRPRLAREPELPPPAARRELPTRRPPPALPDFRPSSHVTRAPLRRLRPSPGAPGARGPGPALVPRPSRAATPCHRPVGRGRGRGWGLRGPAPAPDPARVFLLPGGALLPEPIPRIRSRVFQSPGAGGEDPGRAAVGEGRRRVRWRRATPLRGALPSTRTPLRETQVALLEGLHNHRGSTAPFYRL